MSGRNSQISRLYLMLSILEGAPQGLTVPEIEARVRDRGHEVSRRTIYRDLEALAGAGFPLFPRDRHGEAARWVLERHTTLARHLVLSSRELLALYLARGVLTPLEGTPFFGDLQSTFQKIEEKLGTRAQQYLEELTSELHFEPGPRWGLGLDPEVLDTVRASCSERQLLQVTYASASTGVTAERILGPHFLYFARGSLYLVAEDMVERRMKVFACPRMSQARMLDEVYEGETVDPGEFFATSFGVFRQDGAPEVVRVSFSPQVAPFVRERRWHSTQNVVSQEDGSIELTLEASLTPELIQWILGFGANAQVKSPDSLKEAIAKAAQATLALYRKSAA